MKSWLQKRKEILKKYRLTDDEIKMCKRLRKYDCNSYNLFLGLPQFYFSQAETTGLKKGKLVSSGCAG